MKEPQSAEKTLKRSPTGVKFPSGKRRILSQSTAERKRQKRPKYAIIKSNSGINSQENNDNKTKQTTSMRSNQTTALREFRDFVLPDSIKTDKSGSETPTESSTGVRGSSVVATTKQQIDRY